MSKEPRVRLEAVQVEALGAGRCRARVALRLPRGGHTSGQAEGRDSTSGRLRCAAEAAARALEQAVASHVSLELLGVKALHTFDCIVMVVSLASRVPGASERLVGSCIVPDEDPGGAALAVLNAANRLVSRSLGTGA